MLRSFAVPALAFALSSLLAAQGTVLVVDQVVSQWSTGFSGRITITNQASWTIADWQLEFDASYAVTSLWNALLVQQVGGRCTVTAVQASWEDGDLSPGEVATIDFVANGAPTTPTNATLNGAPIVFGSPSPAPPPLAASAATPWPEQVFAPYVDLTAWPPFDLVGTAQQQRLRFFTLAFVVARAPTDPTPSWGGYYDTASQFGLPAINALRALGGDVMVSFGGAAGTELAAAATSTAQLQAAYQQVIDTYGLTHVDFDIEGIWVAHPTSIARRSQAIAALQAAARAQGRELRVWFTLPVLPSGLTQDGRNVIASALQAGVELDGVNVMAMDYGASAAPNPVGNMGAYANQAAAATQAQLDQLYRAAGQPQAPAALWRKVGVTPMLGVNDVATEVFTVADVAVVSSFARQQGIGLVSCWSLGRDVQCAGGALPYASYNCSSILQAPFAFAQAFAPFTIAAWREVGPGLAGAGGTPQLVGSGSLRAGGSLDLQLQVSAPGTPCAFVLGTAALPIPLIGGTLVPRADAFVFAIAGATGTASLTIPWPSLPPRTAIWQQALALDAGAPQGVAMSPAWQAWAP